MLKRNIIRHSRRLLSTDSVYYKPDLQKLELRWPKLKEDDQQDVIDYLNKEFSRDWNDLDKEHKRAAYYISFGDWGARSADATKATPSQFLLNGWFYFVLISAGGLWYYNKTYVDPTQLRIKLREEVETELKLIEQKNKEKDTNHKSWWKPWSK